MSSNKYLMFSALSSGIAGIITHPMDVIRTNVQVGQKISSTRLSTLYRGLFPSLISLIPMKTLFLTNHDLLKNYLIRHNKFSGTTQEIISTVYSYMLSTGLINPIYSCKTYMQIYDIPLRSAIRDFIKNKKLCFKGITGTWLGISETLIYFIMYDKLKNDRGVSIIYSSFISKTLSSLITYPHEIIRTRLRQSPNIKFRDVIKVL
jgi:solute carrier family 25 protein 33/36